MRKVKEVFNLDEPFRLSKTIRVVEDDSEKEGNFEEKEEETNKTA